MTTWSPLRTLRLNFAPISSFIKFPLTVTFVLGTAIAPVLTLIFADGLYRDDMSMWNMDPQTYIH